LSIERITAMVGEGAALLVSRALSAAGLEPDLETALPRFLAHYDERLAVHTTLYPGIDEALHALAARGPLAVLTNKPQHHTGRLLDALGMTKHFGEVVGGDTPFGRKPDPSGLQHLMAVAGVSAAETVLVGDSAIDLRTAKAAGVRLCLVRYGFGYALAEAELDGSELIADRASDIAPLVLTHERP
jgi:phosphoglycolate phosphatase